MSRVSRRSSHYLREFHLLSFLEKECNKQNDPNAIDEANPMQRNSSGNFIAHILSVNKKQVGAEICVCKLKPSFKSLTQFTVLFTAPWAKGRSRLSGPRNIDRRRS